MHYTLLAPTHQPVGIARLQGILALYRAENWWGPGPDDVEPVRRIIAGSHCFLLVEENERVIGMGRAISDRSSDAYIQDVTVAAERRGRGIGTEIIRRLVARLEADGLGWIGLIAERNSSRFYERLGFQVMADAAPMLRTKS